ncbi:MAG: SGNH/GDSL hydrolase family protein, partial [Puniceicoccales bacterium]
EPKKDGTMPDAAEVFRTITYAEALQQLGAELGVPVVDTFSAIWDAGEGDTLREHAKSLWAFFPQHYSKPETSLVETNGKGDTIHPNAAGHALLAEAVFERIASDTPEDEMALSASTFWRNGKLITQLVFANQGEEKQSGQLRIYPFAQNDLHETFNYSLQPGEVANVFFTWPGVDSPEALLEEPLRRLFRGPSPYLQVLLIVDGKLSLRGVYAPWQDGTRFTAKRYVVEGNEAVIDVDASGETKARRVAIPEGDAVGRFPIYDQTESGGHAQFAAAEFAYTQFGAAVSADENFAVDGSLDEWSGAAWLPVGEPVQARWSSGPMDYRASPEVAFTYWSFAADEEGVFVAIRGTGNLDQDRATLFFDPREPELLGTVGPYYWVDVQFQEGGRVTLRAGDSSPKNSAPSGHWTQTPEGFAAELFVPYAALNVTGWPESGDLGVSIVWRHVSPESGESTFLMWAEDGHPWNTRWYGVVRLNPDGPLPYRVRVE